MSNLVVKAAVAFQRFDVTIITLLAIIVVAIKTLRWCTCRRSRVEAYSTDSSCAHKHSANKPHKGMTSGFPLFETVLK